MSQSIKISAAQGLETLYMVYIELPVEETFLSGYGVHDFQGPCWHISGGEKKVGESCYWQQGLLRCQVSFVNVWWDYLQKLEAGGVHA